VTATVVATVVGVVGSPLDWTAALHAVPISARAMRSAARRSHMNGDGSAQFTRSGIGP